MKIKADGELIYTETFKDWRTLEETYTDYLTSQGKPVPKYTIDSWILPIALFVVNQVIIFVKDKMREKKEEKKYKDFLGGLQQQLDRIIASENYIDPEQLLCQALLDMVKAGKVSIEPETDVERDLINVLNSIRSAHS